MEQIINFSLASVSELTLVLGHLVDKRGIHQSSWDLVVNSLLFHPLQDYLEVDGTPMGGGPEEMAKSRVVLGRGLNENICRQMIQQMPNITKLHIALDTQLLNDNGRQSIEAILNLVACWKRRLVSFKLWYWGQPPRIGPRLLENLWLLLNQASSLQQLQLDVKELGANQSLVEVDLHDILSSANLREFKFGSASHSVWNCLKKDCPIGGIQQIGHLRWTTPEELNNVEPQLAARFTEIISSSPSKIACLLNRFTNLSKLTVVLGNNWKLYQMSPHLVACTTLTTLVIRMHHQERIFTRAELQAELSPTPLPAVKSLVIYKRRTSSHVDNDLSRVSLLFPQVQVFQLRLDQFKCTECNSQMKQCAKEIFQPVARCAKIKAMELVSEGQTDGAFARILLLPQQVMTTH